MAETICAEHANLWTVLWRETCWPAHIAPSEIQNNRWICLAAPEYLENAAADFVEIYASDDEKARITSWERGRQREHILGRIAARLVLQDVGCSPQGQKDDDTDDVLALRPDERRAPQVAYPFAVSIAHKRAAQKIYALALAIRHESAYPTPIKYTVGVDLERIHKPERDLKKRIAVEQEEIFYQSAQKHMQQKQDDAWLTTLRLFAGKEALYKAIDPIYRRMIGFREVALLPALPTMLPVSSSKTPEIHADNASMYHAHLLWLSTSETAHAAGNSTTPRAAPCVVLQERDGWLAASCFARCP